jgi:AcrR family transcriptional regulator
MEQTPRGRPRSEVAKRAILESTRDLIAELGYQQVSIQAIATRSGRSRPTIYRWWASKALIVADLVLSGELTLPQQAVPDSGSLEPDLTDWLDQITSAMADPATAGLMRALITAASDDQAEAELLYAMSTRPYHQALVDRIARGQALGQLTSSSDPTAIADALIGTVLFRALTPGARPAPAASVVGAFF